MTSDKACFGILIGFLLVLVCFLIAYVLGYERPVAWIVLVISVCGILYAGEIARKMLSTEGNALAAMLGLFSLAAFILSFATVTGGYK